MVDTRPGIGQDVARSIVAEGSERRRAVADDRVQTVGGAGVLEVRKLRLAGSFGPPLADFAPIRASSKRATKMMS